MLVFSGRFAAYVWDYAGKMQLMRYFWEAAVELKPENREMVEGVRFPVYQPEALSTLFGQTGLRTLSCGPLMFQPGFRILTIIGAHFRAGSSPHRHMRCHRCG